MDQRYKWPPPQKSNYGSQPQPPYYHGIRTVNILSGGDGTAHYYHPQAHKNYTTPRGGHHKHGGGYYKKQGQHARHSGGLPPPPPPPPLRDRRPHPPGQASASATTTSANSDVVTLIVENNNLKRMIMLHLNLMQEQTDNLAAKDKEIDEQTIKITDLLEEAATLKEEKAALEQQVEDLRKQLLGQMKRRASQEGNDEDSLPPPPPLMCHASTETEASAYELEPQPPRLLAATEKPAPQKTLLETHLPQESPPAHQLVAPPKKEKEKVVVTSVTNLPPTNLPLINACMTIKDRGEFNGKKVSTIFLHRVNKETGANLSLYHEPEAPEPKPAEKEEAEQEEERKEEEELPSGAPEQDKVESIETQGEEETEEGELLERIEEDIPVCDEQVVDEEEEEDAEETTDLETAHTNVNNGHIRKEIIREAEEEELRKEKAERETKQIEPEPQIEEPEIETGLEAEAEAETQPQLESETESEPESEAEEEPAPPVVTKVIPQTIPWSIEPTKRRIDIRKMAQVNQIFPMVSVPTTMLAESAELEAESYSKKHTQPSAHSTPHHRRKQQSQKPLLEAIAEPEIEPESELFKKQLLANDEGQKIIQEVAATLRQESEEDQQQEQLQQEEEVVVEEATEVETVEFYLEGSFGEDCIEMDVHTEEVVLAEREKTPSPAPPQSPQPTEERPPSPAPAIVSAPPPTLMPAPAQTRKTDKSQESKRTLANNQQQITPATPKPPSMPAPAPAPTTEDDSSPPKKPRSLAGPLSSKMKQKPSNRSLKDKRSAKATLSQEEEEAQIELNEREVEQKLHQHILKQIQQMPLPMVHLKKLNLARETSLLATSSSGAPATKAHLIFPPEPPPITTTPPPFSTGKTTPTMSTITPASTPSTTPVSTPQPTILHSLAVGKATKGLAAETIVRPSTSREAATKAAMSTVQTPLTPQSMSSVSSSSTSSSLGQKDKAAAAAPVTAASRVATTSTTLAYTRSRPTSKYLSTSYLYTTRAWEDLEFHCDYEFFLEEADELLSDNPHLEIPKWKHVHPSIFRASNKSAERSRQEREALSDEDFRRRHEKFVRDEIDRKKRDSRYLREQIRSEELRRRHNQDEVLVPLDPLPMSTFYPLPEDIETVNYVTDVPVQAFGEDLVNVQPGRRDFSLPWLEAANAQTAIAAAKARAVPVATLASKKLPTTAAEARHQEMNSSFVFLKRRKRQRRQR